MIVIYAYAMAYVSGEVKRPDKSLIMANASAVVVPIAIGVVAFIGLSRMVDFNFLSAASWNDLNGPVKGLTTPWTTSFMDIVFVASGFNRVIGVLLSLTWLLSTIGVLTVAVLMCQRPLFAWGMDRMGPKFFTDVSPKWGSPVKMYGFVCLVSGGLEIVYVLWLQSALSGLIAAGMMVVSVFGVTAVSGILFPYRKRAQTIWQSSPYRKWTVAGVPVVTIAGAFYLAFVCLIVYFGFLDPKTRDTTGKNLIEFAVVWVLGIAWYFVWKWLRERGTEMDMSLMLKELPPE
jgi:amino acid transporter